MSLTIEDKQYIGTAITNNNGILRTQFQKDMQDSQDRLFNRFKSETDQYMGALKEGFEHKVDMLAELIRERPTRSEVVDMIQEHTRPIVRQEMYKFASTELVPIFDDIRLSLRNHDKRISRLESSLQH